MSNDKFCKLVEFDEKTHWPVHAEFGGDLARINGKIYWVTEYPVYIGIEKERDNQKKKWGGEITDDMRTGQQWFSFIQYQLALFLNGWHQRHRLIMRERLVKVAALAVAAIESLDRKAKHVQDQG